MDPINYLGMVPQVDFAKDIGLGFQAGQMFQQRNLENEKRQAALDQAKQYQADLQAAMASPTPQNFASLALKYPQQREAVKQAWDGLSEGDRKAEGDTMAQAYSALLAGDQELAKKVVRNQIDARKNSGLDTSHYDNALTLLDGDQKQALGALGFTLSHINDPKAFATQFSSLQGNQRATELQPDLVRKGSADATAAEADATTSGVKAKYAEQGALLDLQKKGWDIKQLQSDIQYKKDQTRIETMKVALARSDNDLKRQELGLKIKEAQTTLDNKVRERADEAQTQIDGAKSVTGLIDEIFGDPDSLAAVTGSSAWKGAIPGTTNRAVAGKIEQLSNMLGALNLDKLKGPTSDKDIMFVKSIAANLDRYQDEGEFKKVLGKVRDITARREEQLRKKFGVPASKEDPAIQPRNVVVDY